MEKPAVIPIKIGLTFTEADDNVKGFGFVEAAIEKGGLEVDAVLFFHIDFHAIVVDIAVVSLFEAALYGCSVGGRRTKIVGRAEVGLDDGLVTGDAGMAVVGWRRGLKRACAGLGGIDPLSVDPADDGCQGKQDGIAAPMVLHYFQIIA